MQRPYPRCLLSALAQIGQCLLILLAWGYWASAQEGEEVEAVDDQSQAVAIVRVQPGDTLSEIADRYASSIAAIQEANGLRSDRIFPGDYLTVPFFPPAPPRQAPPGLTVYTMRVGDTLWGIRQRYGVTEEDLVGWNPDLPSLDRIPAGTTINILPVRGVLHTVEADQDFFSVASQYGVDPAELARANHIENPFQILPGDQLLIPRVRPTAKLQELQQVRAQEQEELRRRLELARRQAAERERRRAQELARQRREIANRNLMTPGGFAWPLSGKLTSGFGRRRIWINGSNFHTGIDIAKPAGTPIRAAQAGLVTFAGWDRSGYGYLTKVDHGSGFETYYAHQSRLAVVVGQRISRGDIIGYVGSTGFSSGPHLHFEIRVNGQPYNPRDYLP
ncbi:MAG: peptidoglycan DD-metalloendopeptidase family protein [Deinococcus sp.]|nr:peptidoglycan DD-metalloendopeptidase family protein [Deinococcus sp.]